VNIKKEEVKASSSLLSAGCHAMDEIGNIRTEEARKSAGIILLGLKMCMNCII
jgi:hypothetical protein